MRKTILILPLFILAYTLYGQENLLLKKFKYRVNNYRQIYFNLGGGSQLYNSENVSGEYKTNVASGNLGAAYSQIKSTDKILLTLSGGVGLNMGTGKSDNRGSISKSKSSFVSSQFGVLIKWFRRNLFAELGADLSAHSNRNKYTSGTAAVTRRFDQDDYAIAIKLGIGKGRLENITDMQNALWLYKTLQDEKKLSRSLNEDELNELGHTITLAKNTRVLDLRKRTQFTLETTDRFFREKDILAADDIRYFSSLNDILFFAVNNERLSGTEIFLRVTPATNRATDDETDNSAFTKYENRIVTKSALLSAGINRYIPANLRHQNNYGASLRLKYVSYHEEDKYSVSGSVNNQSDRNTTIKQAGANVFFEHAVYPNTRTIISFDLTSEAGYQDLELSSGCYGMAQLDASVNYFISYRTTITCTAGARYQKETYSYGINDRLVLLPDILQLFVSAGLHVNL